MHVPAHERNMTNIDIRRQSARASVNPQEVVDVAKSCSCSNEDALELLRLSGNDPHKAIQRHQLRLKYLGCPITPRINGTQSTQSICTASSRQHPQTEDCHENTTMSSPPPESITAGRPHSASVSSQGSTCTFRTSRSGAQATGSNGQVPWDFLLPRVNPSAMLVPGDAFHLETVVGALCYGNELDTVQAYLQSYGRHVVRDELRGNVHGFPTIFYAVASNNDDIVRTWVEYGADVKSIHQPSGTPLLAFAIINSANIEVDTTSVVATLLSLGADPRVIPCDIYSPYDEDLPEGEVESGVGGSRQQEDKLKWCNGAAKKKLLQTANLMQRYYLDRATKMKQPSIRQRQVAKLRNAEPILGLPYFLIGQNLAANRLLQKLLSYLMTPTKRPLVLVFAGPSGHGKTELARRLGYLLSLDLEVVDCTIVRREMELFGPRHPYVGAEKGSSLNNFLAKHAGQRCVVFLDEFEKTTQEIHQALLLPFDNGEYQDRRHGTKVNCSKTIWILATNALDSTIHDFCSQNDEMLGHDEAIKQTLAKQLSRILRQKFLDQFGAPVTGRISDFIPFLEFCQGEQAVVADKFLLELVRQVRNPVDLSRDMTGQLLGDIRLRILHDASICRILAAEFYNRHTGARSLVAAAEMIRDDDDMLIEKYLDENKEIVAGCEVKNFCIDVKGDAVVVYKI